MARLNDRTHVHDDMTARQSTLSQDVMTILVRLAMWFLIAIGPLLVGLCILGWQVYQYLYAGNWVGVSLLDFVYWAHVQREWIEAPMSWLGLWKILNWIPLSLLALVYGGVMTLVLTFEAGDKPPDDSWPEELKSGRAE